MVLAAGHGRRFRWSLLLAVAVILAGCGSDADEDDTRATPRGTRTTDPSGSVAPETGFEESPRNEPTANPNGSTADRTGTTGRSDSTERTRRNDRNDTTGRPGITDRTDTTTTSTTDDTGPEERTIEVGGPTIDNQYPDESGVFEANEELECLILEFPEGQPDNEVRIERISVTDGHWTANPGVEGPCFDFDSVGSPYPDPALPLCANHILRPNSNRCRLYVRLLPVDPSDAKKEYAGSLRIALSVRCTDRATGVCAKLPKGDAPTVQRPVTAKWEVDAPVRCFDPCTASNSPSSTQ